MKMLRPLLAGLLVLAAGAPRASLVTTITVTTNADEDGSNSAACSLREAVKAVNSRAPYGGCPAGSAFDDNLVQLQPGRYLLSLGELQVTAEMTIAGANSQAEANAEVKDPLTGLVPRRYRPDHVDSDAGIGETGTWIIAGSGRRVAELSAPVNFTDLVLIGSYHSSQTSPAAVAGNGGVLYAGGSLGLDNVIIRGGRATGGSASAGNGGAIYLAGDNTALNLTSVTLEGNHAENRGGAIAMLCRVDLSPFASHSVTLTRSLLRGNSSTAGAGAVELCGNTAGTLDTTTLSGNVSEANSGALAYVQGANLGLGRISLNYVTAVEQVGHVLAVNGLASVLLTGSLLSAFDTAGGTEVCHNPDPAVDMVTNGTLGGSRNAIDADGSCPSLLAVGGDNIGILVDTPLTSVLQPIQIAGSYYPATPAGAPYGLTDYYLPLVVVGSPVLDQGEALESCATSDQRNASRKSGTACDIGAVERLQVTARDDEGDSRRDTDRLVIVDILANDSFGESDGSGPYAFAANDDAASSAVTLIDDAGGSCVWHYNDDADYPDLLVVNTGGELTEDDAPVECQYVVNDSSSATSSTVATVSVQVKNAAPNALNDAYLRPVGVASLDFDPMENDNDEGDGKYGLVEIKDAGGAVIGYGPETAWASFYPVEITAAPELGEIVGTSSGQCPGISSTARTCLTPPLRYIADNNLSPFSDSFSYRIYDADSEASNAATVTIYTDAEDPDKGGGAGSFDLLGGLLLGLLGLRRLRRL